MCMLDVYKTKIPENLMVKNIYLRLEMETFSI